MKLIIFDVDGTLCHSKYIDDKCYINAFKKALNINIENTNWDTYKHVTDYYTTYDIISKSLNIKPTKDIIDKVIDTYAEELRYKVYQVENKYTAVPGSKELIKHLQEQSELYVTGIATGGFEKTAIFKLELLGLDFPKENIFCSGKYVTKHEMIKAFIQKENDNGRILERVLYVGDREYDYIVTKELNIDFIGIDFRGNGKLRSLGIEKVINNYEPIEKFLELI
ncbi:MAG: HAD family hydrolase [Ignavibacteria bacterium]|nr:HAD family hydrolase [Ignavibacteria bacterium]